jgi:PIN domain nuclease of toxin-antitoxin system
VDNIKGLLLDTCAIIYLTTKRKMADETEELIDKAAYEEKIYVSPISSWEVGSLVSLGRLKLTSPPDLFFFGFLQQSSATLCDLTPEILINSSFLPGRIHKDPMDRILVSTARKNGLALVTSDRAILAYGREGHVKTLAC